MKHRPALRVPQCPLAELFEISMITSALAPGKAFLASIAFAPVEVKVKQEENAGEACVAPVQRRLISRDAVCKVVGADGK